MAGFGEWAKVAEKAQVLCFNKKRGRGMVSFLSIRVFLVKSIHVFLGGKAHRKAYLIVLVLLSEDAQHAQLLFQP